MRAALAAPIIMKTSNTKKLTLDVQTVRVLQDETLDQIAGGRRMGIVSTDSPSGCRPCNPRSRPRPRPVPGPLPPWGRGTIIVD